MKYAKRMNLCLIGLAALTGIGTVVQSVFLLLYYDSRESLYQSGTPSFPVPAIVIALLLFSVAICFALPGGKFVLPGQVADHSRGSDTDLGTILLKIGALLLLIGAVLPGILLIYGDFPGDHAHALWQGAVSGTLDGSVALAGRLLQIAAYGGALAAVYPSVLLITGKTSPISAICTVAWMLLLALSVYCDTGSVLNDPCRSLQIIGLCAAILWLVYEIKRELGGGGRRSYTIVSFGAFGVLCISSIPRLIATAAGKLDFTSQTLTLVAMLGIAIEIAGRFCQLRSLPDPVPAESGTQDEKSEKFDLKTEIRRTIYAPDTDLSGLPDDSDDTDDTDDTDTDGIDGQGELEDGLFPSPTESADGSANPSTDDPEIPPKDGESGHEDGTV